MTSLQPARWFARTIPPAWFVLAGFLAGCGTSTPPPVAKPSTVVVTPVGEPLVLEPILTNRRPGRNVPASPPTGTTPPQLLSRANPVYPPILSKHRIEGEATVAFVVMENGTPQEVECVRAHDRRFAEAAVEAVKKWRFKPALWQGKPVPMSMQVPVVFTLGAGSRARLDPPGIAAPSALTLTGDAQRDYQRLQTLQASQPPPGFARESDEHFNWLQERRRTLYDLGLEYISRHRTDARRWDVLLLLQYGRNHHIQVLRDGSRQLVPEPAEFAAWEQKYYPWLEELIHSNDASAASCADALRQLINHAAQNVDRGDPDAEATISRVLAWLERLERENSGQLSSLYHAVSRMLSTVDPQRSARFLNEKRAAHGKDERMRTQLDRILHFVTGQQRPVTELWRQLQELDPALGDGSAYRGKVVLIASLAVDWSSRTVELEDLYRKYHDAGLEIVQVAYYNANRSAPPEQRDKAAMQRYVAARQWPWRVVWDPKDHPEESFWDYWGQNTVPAFFLIGRDGCIARPRPKKLGLDRLIADELAWSTP